MKIAILVAALVFSSHAYADTATKNAKIAEIIKVQKLHEMMQEQIEAGKAQASDVGKRMFDKMLADSGLPPSAHQPEFDKIFKSYLDRASAMFTARELVDTWAKFYGKDLSEADLDKILAYYKSPVGIKDVNASQAAMRLFGAAIMVESEKRLEAAIAQMSSELAAALKRIEEGKK